MTRPGAKRKDRAQRWAERNVRLKSYAGQKAVIATDSKSGEGWELGNRCGDYGVQPTNYDRNDWVRCIADILRAYDRSKRRSRRDGRGPGSRLPEQS